MYAIIRMQKIKSWGAVGATAGHNLRLTPVENADPARAGLNKNLVGSMDLAADMRARIGGATIRKNAVLGAEIFLSGTHEHFAKPGATKAFCEASMAYLRKTYGDNLVSAQMHLDEQTPHVHAVVVPMVEGRLNARALWGGSRRTLAIMQDKFAESVSSLGLQRGQRGSTAKHTTVQQFYTMVRAPTPKFTRKQYPPVPGLTDRTEAKIRAYGKECVDIMLKAIEPVFDALQAKVRMYDFEREHKPEIAAQQASIKDIAAMVRQIMPSDVLAKMGYTAHEGVYHTAAGSVSLSGNKIALNGTVIGTNAIDLVKAINDYNFEDGVAWLAENFSETAAIGTGLAHQHDRIIGFAQGQRPIDLPKPIDATWNRVQHYLVTTRKIPLSIVTKAKSTGRLWSDVHGNAVFALVDKDGQITGAELRGTTDAPFHGTRGDKELFVVPRDNATKTVFCESAIDALSLSAMCANFNIVSTGGTNIKRALEYARAAQERGQTIVAAFDSDKSGEEFARLFARRAAEKWSPAKGSKDWNDHLRAHGVNSAGLVTVTVKPASTPPAPPPPPASTPPASTYGGGYGL